MHWILDKVLRKKAGESIVAIHQVPILSSFFELKISLGEGAALDLLAVLAALELLVVGLVLGRYESSGKPAEKDEKKGEN